MYVYVYTHSYMYTYTTCRCGTMILDKRKTTLSEWVCTHACRHMRACLRYVRTYVHVFRQMHRQTYTRLVTHVHGAIKRSFTHTLAGVHTNVTVPDSTRIGPCARRFTSP